MKNAIEMNPNDHKSFFTLAMILNSSKSYSELLEIFSKIKNPESNREKYLFVEGFALMNLERYNEAIKKF
jgi:tetratricopeptide (TPR) repeat protein